MLTAGCSTQKCRKKCCLLLPETSRFFFFLIFIFFCSSWKRGRLISHPASGCILIKSFVQWLQSILHIQQDKSPSDRYYLAYFYSWEFAAFGAIRRRCLHLVISSAEWMCQDGCFKPGPSSNTALQCAWVPLDPSSSASPSLSQVWQSSLPPGKHFIMRCCRSTSEGRRPTDKSAFSFWLYLCACFLL